MTAIPIWTKGSPYASNYRQCLSALEDDLRCSSLAEFWLTPGDYHCSEHLADALIKNPGASIEAFEVIEI